MLRATAGIATAAALALPATAQAGTFTVDRVADTPPSQRCDATPTQCSLREAVNSANASPGADTIELPGGHYELTTHEQLLVTDPLTIQRTGATRAVIDANSGSRVIRSEGGAPLTLTGLDVREGRLDGPDAEGAGIRAGGPLTLDDVTVEANHAEGPDVVGAGVAFAGTLTVTSSRFTGNSAISAGTASGGALGALAPTSVTITDSAFSGNLAQGVTLAHGGAAFLEGTTTMTRVTLQANTARTGSAEVWGGAIDQVSGPATYDHVTFSGNEAEASNGSVIGGALAHRSRGALTVTDSTFTGNTARAALHQLAQGGALYLGNLAAGQITRSRITGSLAVGGDAQGGGVFAGITSTLAIAASTIDGNAAEAMTGGDALGGGLYLDDDATASVLNSTLHLNTAITGGTAGTAVGGGLYLRNGSAVRATTVTANRVATGGAGIAHGAGIGGPGAAATVHLEGSIVAANPGAGSAQDCQAVTVDSGGGNVVGHPGPLACALSPLPTDVFADDPRLDPLADRGGPTPTLRPQHGSVALDRYSAGCPATDQRGVARPQGAACDAGSFEARATEIGARPPVAAPLPGCTDLAATTEAGRAVTLALACAPIVWSWEIVQPPAHGTLSPIGPDGTVTYTPAPGFSGIDAFRFRSVGHGGTSSPATATVTVEPGPPAAAAPPAAGTSLPDGASEPGRACATAPKLTGLTVKRARAVLRRVSCAGRLKVERRGSRRGAPRRIVAQIPAAGSALSPGQAVAVTAAPRRRAAAIV